MAFQQLLAVPNCVECSGPRADGAKPNTANAIHDSANPKEGVQIALEAIGRGMANMLLGQGELDASLHEIVANGDLAAVSVASPRNIEPAQIIGIALNENR